MNIGFKQFVIAVDSCAAMNL